MKKMENKIQIFYEQLIPKPIGDDKLEAVMMNGQINNEINLDTINAYLSKKESSIILPHIIDHIKRKDIVTNISQLFAEYQAVNDNIQELEISGKELIVMATHYSSHSSIYRIFLLAIQAGYPLPLVYPLNEDKKDYYSTQAYSILLTLINKPLVLFSSKTPNETSSLIVKFFQTSKSRMNKSGELSSPAINLHFTFDKEKLDPKGILAEIVSQSHSSEFEKARKQLANLSCLIVSVFSKKDLKEKTDYYNQIKNLVSRDMPLNAKIIIIFNDIKDEKEFTQGIKESLIKEFQPKFAECFTSDILNFDKRNIKIRRKGRQTAESFWRIYGNILDNLKQNYIERIISEQWPYPEINLPNLTHELFKKVDLLDQDKCEEFFPNKKFNEQYRNEKFHNHKLMQINPQGFTEIMGIMHQIFISAQTELISLIDYKLDVIQTEKTEPLLQDINKIAKELAKNKDEQMNLVKQKEDASNNNLPVNFDLTNAIEENERKIAQEERELNGKYISIQEKIKRYCVFFSTYCEEMLTNNKLSKEKSEFLEKYVKHFHEGMPIQLIRGSPPFCQITSFDQVISLINRDFNSEKLSVVSIVGDKSNLVNYICGGNYFTLKNGVACYLTNFHPGHQVLILDTGTCLTGNGIATLQDQQLIVFALLCSQIVIHNQQGSFVRGMGQIWQICLFAFKQLNPRRFIPNIIFALRDQVESDPLILHNEFGILRNNIMEALKSVGIELEKTAKLSVDNIFQLVPALLTPSNSLPGKNPLKLSKSFPGGISKLLSRIGKILEEDQNAYKNINEFYEMSTRAFNMIQNMGCELFKNTTIDDMEIKFDIRGITLKHMEKRKLAEKLKAKAEEVEFSILKSIDKNEMRALFTDFQGKLIEIEREERDYVYGAVRSEIKKDIGMTLLEQEKIYIAQSVSLISKLCAKKLDDYVSKRRYDMKYERMKTECSNRIGNDRKLIEKALDDVNKKIEKLGKKVNERLKQLEQQISMSIKTEFDKELEEKQQKNKNLILIRNISESEITSKEIQADYNNWLTNKDAIVDIEALHEIIKKILEEEKGKILEIFQRDESKNFKMKEFMDAITELANRIGNELENSGVFPLRLAITNDIYRIFMQDSFEQSKKKEEEECKNNLQFFKNFGEELKKILEATNEEKLAILIATQIQEQVRNKILTEYSSDPNNKIRQIFPNYRIVITNAFASIPERDIETLELFFTKKDDFVRNFVKENIKNVLQNELDQFKRLICESLAKESSLGTIKYLLKDYVTIKYPEYISDESQPLENTLKFEETFKSEFGKQKTIKDQTIETNLIEKLIEECVSHCTEKCPLCGAECTEKHKFSSEMKHEAFHNLLCFEGYKHKMLDLPVLELCNPGNIREKIPQSWDYTNIEYITPDKKLLEQIWIDTKGIRYIPIDIVLLVDCTGTMINFLKKITLFIQTVQNELNGIYSFISIFWGFVGYRDHLPGEALEKLKNEIIPLGDNNVELICKKLGEKNFFRGGNDYCEAVNHGLDSINKMNWRNNSKRIVFHFFDAPPHGQQFHPNKREIIYDNFPDECCGIKCEEKLREMNHSTSYIMLHHNRSQTLDDMIKIFMKSRDFMWEFDSIKACSNIKELLFNRGITK